MTRIAGCLAPLLAIFLFSACSLETLAGAGKPSFTEVSCLGKNPDRSAAKSVFLVNQGWHTGVAVASSDVRQSLGSVFSEASNSDWIEIGWGDRDFYLSSGYSLWRAFLAAFFSADSVLQIAGFSRDPKVFFSGAELFQIFIEEEGLSRLAAKVRGTAVLDESGKGRSVAKSLYGEGGFYEASGDFSIFYTCNSWARDLLVAAGCPIRGKPIRSSSLSKELGKLPRPSPQN